MMQTVRYNNWMRPLRLSYVLILLALGLLNRN